MSLDVNAIARYKNTLCVTNFLLTLGFIFFGYAEINLDVRTTIGIIGVTLSPIIWNEWLYEEFCDGTKHPIMTSRTFLLIGLFMAASVFFTLWYAFFTDTF